MRSISENLYAEWRRHGSTVQALGERSDDAPLTERQLQSIWQHQRIHRDRLTSLDGRSLRILHPGFWNHEAGPDFRDAIVQIGSTPPVTGDIEIDLVSQCWRHHEHHTNPNFQNVVLHVIWDGRPDSAAPLPTLPLHNVLDAPLEEIMAWIGTDTSSHVPESLVGQCRGPLRDLPADVRSEVLRQAAWVRLQAKAARFEARARQAGWEQALWEGLFSALGYKHNVWPMLRMAELIPVLRGEESAQWSSFQWEARLLGVSGLLSAELPRGRKTTSEHIRRVWDFWWREREVLSDVALPRELWRLGGVRPANHPQRRLALAAHWVSSRDWVKKLEAWFASPIADDDLLPALRNVLMGKPDEFWGWHWTLDSKRMDQRQPLLGPPRTTDLAMNVILPWLWMRAASGKNETMRRRAERRYFVWPKGEDNVVLKLARNRLFGGAQISGLRTAAVQQGLMQIVRDFCEHSNALCESCRFPELVRSLGSRAPNEHL